MSYLISSSRLIKISHENKSFHKIRWNIALDNTICRHLIKTVIIFSKWFMANKETNLSDHHTRSFLMLLDDEVHVYEKKDLRNTSMVRTLLIFNHRSGTFSIICASGLCSFKSFSYNSTMHSE